LLESLLQAAKKTIADTSAIINLPDFIKLSLVPKLLNVELVGKVFKRDPIRVLTS